MPATTDDYRKASEAARNRASEASEYNSTALTLKDSVMDAVMADRGKRGISQLAQDVGNTMGQLATDPADIRVRTGDMVNPLKVDQITARQRGQNLNTLGTIATQERENTRSLEDIIGAGSNQLNARANSLLAEAQKKQAEADAIMNELRYDLSVRQQDFSEFIQRANLDLARAKFNASGSGSGRGNLKRSEDEIKNDNLDYTKRVKVLQESFAGLGVLNEENAASFAEDVNALGAAVEEGDYTAGDALQLLYAKYAPTGGFNVVPSQEEIDAEVERMRQADRDAGVPSPLAQSAKDFVSKYSSGPLNYGGQINNEDIERFIQSLPPEEQARARELQKQSNLGK